MKSTTRPGGAKLQCSLQRRPSPLLLHQPAHAQVSSSQAEQSPSKERNRAATCSRTSPPHPLEGSQTAACAPLFDQSCQFARPTVCVQQLLALQVLRGCPRESNTTACCAGSRNTVGFGEKCSTSPGKSRSVELGGESRTTPLARGVYTRTQG